MGSAQRSMAKKHNKKRQRRRGRKNRSLNRSVFPVLCIAAVFLLAGVYWAYQFNQNRNVRAAYARSWEIADRQFSRRALDDAKKEYRGISNLGDVDAGIDESEAVKQLADHMQTLCSAIEKRDISAVAETLVSVEASPETLSFASTDDDILSREDRLGEIRRWAKDEILKAQRQLAGFVTIQPPSSLDAAEKLIAGWDQTAIESAVDDLRRWQPHAESFGESSATISSAIGSSENGKRFVAELSKLTAATQTALVSLGEKDLADAGFQWESLQTAFPKLVDSSLWQDYREKLRQSIRNRLAGTASLSPTKSSAGEAQPAGSPRPIIPLGTMSTGGPKRIDLDDLLAIGPGIDGQSVSKSLVFARVHQHCYAIDAESGVTKWVIQVGHDAKWLPEMVAGADGDLVHCITVDGKNESVSVLAADGSHQWTMNLPNGQTCAGPPVVVGRQMHLLLAAGELWSLNLKDGGLISRLQLPETTSSPMVVREDRKGVMIIGDKLGLYLVSVQDRPEVMDVVFPDQDANTLSSRGLWIPPFAVVFQNELTETCRIKVYRQKDDEYQKVQDASLEGRLWDSPAVVGADFLVVTDAITESIRHVDIDRPIDPIEPRFERVTRTSYPRRPFFLSHPDAPFLSVRDSTLVCYWIDPLASNRERKPMVRWEHAFPNESFTATQPLRISGDKVIIAAQSPGRRSVLVKALSLKDGKPVWSVDLGGEITSALQTKREAILRTDAGQMVLVSSDAKGLVHQPLPLDSTGAEFDWIPRARAVVRVAPEKDRIQAISFSGSEISSCPIVDPPNGPVSVRVGAVRFQGKQAVEKNGVWCALVDTQSRLQVYSLSRNLGQDRTGVEIVYHQLREAPAGRWQRPLWIKNGGLVLAHSSGWILRAELKSEAGVHYVAADESTKVKLDRLAGPLCVQGDSIWAAEVSGKLYRLSRDNLETISVVTMQAGISSPLVPILSPESNSGKEALILGLKNGIVAVTHEGDAGKPKISFPVSQRPIVHIRSVPEGIWMIDKGGAAYWLANDLLRGGTTASKKLTVVQAATNLDTRVPPIRLGQINFIAGSSGQRMFLSQPPSSPKPRP